MANTKKPGSESSPKAEKKTKAPKAASPAAKTKKAAPGDETAAAKVLVTKTPKSKGKGPSSGPRRPMMERTYFAKPGEVPAKWKLIDASKQPLGRLSTLVAQLLMGKDKPAYTRFSDTGDFVIVVNAKEIELTGNKWEDKVYKYHTNYAGGLKTFTARELLEKNPERIVERAVYGMLPYKGHMARKWYSKLRVFAGPDHPHAAQKPEQVKLPYLGTRKEA